MRKSNQAVAKVFLPPSEMNWTDEKLAALSKEQLLNLFENLQTQRESGRVTAQAADDLARNISALLPAKALVGRRKRPRHQVLLEEQVAQQLSTLAATLEGSYDLSTKTAKKRSADTEGFKAQALTKRGAPHIGESMTSGRMTIDRYLAYRLGDSLACLAFLLFPGQPNESGRFVVLATDDLLPEETTPSDFAPLAQDHGWSDASRARMRAQPADDFGQAAERFEALIARLAPKLN